MTDLVVLDPHARWRQTCLVPDQAAMAGMEDALVDQVLRAMEAAGVPRQGLPDPFRQGLEAYIVGFDVCVPSSLGRNATRFGSWPGAARRARAWEAVEMAKVIEDHRNPTPDVAAAPTEPERGAQGRIGRRTFVMRCLGAVGAYVGASLVAIFGATAVAPILTRRTTWSLWPRGAIAPTPHFLQPWTALGDTAKFPDGQITLATVEVPVQDAWVKDTQPVAVYVKRAGTAFTVFDIHCTHMGCAVNWTPGADRFFCPCHGGAYNADGQVVAGPPPFPLYRYTTKISAGQLYIGKLQDRGEL